MRLCSIPLVLRRLAISVMVQHMGSSTETSTGNSSSHTRTPYTTATEAASSINTISSVGSRTRGILGQVLCLDLGASDGVVSGGWRNVNEQ